MQKVLTAYKTFAFQGFFFIILERENISISALMKIEFVAPPSSCQFPVIIWITLPGVFCSEDLIN